MEILKVLLIIIVSIVISGVEIYFLYGLLSAANQNKSNGYVKSTTVDALIGAIIFGIIVASINSGIMYWIIF